MKVNTNRSAIDDNASYGGIFRDHLGTYLGSFACNLGNFSVFNSEILLVTFVPWSMWPGMVGEMSG